MMMESYSRFKLTGSEMNISDRMQLSMTQQQDSLKKTLSSETKQRGKLWAKSRRSSEDSNISRLEEDGDNEEDDNIEPDMVVNNLLPLVKDLVEFGKRCDELQEIADRSDNNSIPAAAARALENLSFEVVVAMARISISLNKL